MTFMQVRLPIHNSIKVVPEIPSILLAPIARYLLIMNSEMKYAITWFRKNRLFIIYEVTLATYASASECGYIG
jgi:hypothetical protein